MMVSGERFQTFARSLGIDDDSKVVLYDENIDATRLWWGFCLYGKTDVRILDGGYEAWKSAGYPTESGSGRKKDSRQGNFTARTHTPGLTWNMEHVRRSETDKRIQLWDTREPDEWSGKRLMRGAARRGRIGWARFLSWKEFRRKVNNKTPTEFRTAAEMQKVIDKHGIDKNKDQVFYCQSGVRTTTVLFSLYLMGWDIDKLHNYDGSWIEWSHHAENPVVSDP